jgi:hypothetical protein
MGHALLVRMGILRVRLVRVVSVDFKAVISSRMIWVPLAHKQLAHEDLKISLGETAPMILVRQFVSTLSRSAGLLFPTWAKLWKSMMRWIPRLRPR